MKRRVTIFGLMGMVGLAGVALAALRSASALWASILFTIAIFATTIAAIGAFAAHGRARATWGGFAIACSSYLWATFGPLAVAGGIIPPPLLTTLLFSKVIERAAYVATTSPEKWPEDSLDDLSFLGRPDLASDPWPPVPPTDVAPLPPGTRQIFRIHFFRIGHTLTALILGLGGAMLGYRIARNTVQSNR